MALKYISKVTVHGHVEPPSEPHRARRAGGRARARLARCGFSVLLAVACGRTEPVDSTERYWSLGNEGGAQVCDEHAECDDDSVCIGGACIFFGQCLRDAHCNGRTCVDNECVGQANAPGPPLSCEINNDCPERHYCVDGACHRGTECLRHAHCSLTDACLGQACVPLF